MRALAALLALAAVFWALAVPVRAELAALARLDAGASSVADAGAAGIEIVLPISQPVPYRLRLMDDPPRLVADFSKVDFGAAGPRTVDRSARVVTLSWGPVSSGWSRLVAELDGPYRIESAEQETAPGPGAVIRIRLEPASADEFAALAAKPETETEAEAAPVLPPPARVGAPRQRQTGERPLVVVLDPGHGGIDPGAEADGMTEAEVILGFSRELAEVLRRAGMTVVLTREEDVFVPLETRISIARAASADVFLSLHADALEEGEAVGATVYLLDESASDEASSRLAERHDRADLLSGVDLSGHDDEVAQVLMDLARTETAPRSARLAQALADGIGAAGLTLHRRPIQQAEFSVLKAADIPSVLLEVGFLSSEADRKRIADPLWRARMQGAILVALRAWSVADAAEARLLRQ